jgi:putative transposase
MSKKVPFQAKQEQDSVRLRHEAMDRYLSGEKPSQIARRLGRSHQWFYNTLARYQEGGREGLENRSRAPHRVHNRTPPDVEAAIVRIRQTIVSGADPELRYANWGAGMIASELRRLEMTPPSERTIERVFQRHGLVQSPSTKPKGNKLPEDYPWPRVYEANQLHLFDFVRRSLDGGTSFYGCHLLDQFRRWPFLRIIERKQSKAVSQFLVSAWQTIGLPQALYLDNDVVWRGSSSAPRTISRIIRLCLLAGVNVIFTPPYTPEANPMIESFNGVWSRNFWQRIIFDNLEQVRTELAHFQRFCRERRPLPEFEGRTASHCFADFQPRYLAPDFALHEQKHLPISAGQVHFIRFVAENGTFSILNESWDLNASRWAGKTIRATVDTAAEQLRVYHQANANADPLTIACFDYPLSEEVLPVAKCYQRHYSPLWTALASLKC